jgi:hypothetical protein
MSVVYQIWCIVVKKSPLDVPSRERSRPGSCRRCSPVAARKENDRAGRNLWFSCITRKLRRG